MCALRLMPVWMKLCLLAAILGVLLKGQPTPATPVVFGTPPGGVGAACTAPQIGYLNTSTGCLATCQSSVWTCQGGSGGINLWTQSAGTLSPTTPTDSVTIGTTVINPTALTASAPTVTKTGSGSSTWGYGCVYYNNLGHTAISAETTIANQAAALDGTHVNHVTCPVLAGTTGVVDIYIITAGSGGTTGQIAEGETAGVAFNDSTGEGDGDPPTESFTAGIFAPLLAIGGSLNNTQAALVNSSDHDSSYTLLGLDFRPSTTKNDQNFELYSANVAVGQGDSPSTGNNTGVVGFDIDIAYSGAGSASRVTGLISAATTTEAGGATSATSVLGAYINGAKHMHGTLGTLTALEARITDSYVCTSAPCITDLVAVTIPAIDLQSGNATNATALMIGDFSAAGTTISRNLWSKGANSVNLFEGNVQTGGFLSLTGNVVNPFRQVKNTQSATAPGAGIADLRWIAGTNAGTCKLVGAAGTSATEVTIIDNVGGGC